MRTALPGNLQTQKTLSCKKEPRTAAASGAASIVPIFKAHALAVAAIAIALLIGACSPTDERRAEMAGIHAKQAAAYQASGQFRAAVIEARNVIQKAPQQASGYQLLAGILVDLGQYRSALDVLDQAPAGSANDELLLTRLEALLGRGKFSSALALLDESPGLVQKNPDKALYLRARALAGQDQLEEAAKSLQDLLRQSPNNVEALVALADVEILQQEIDAAKSLLSRADEIDADNIDKNLLRAKIHILAGDYANAEKELSETLILLPQADTLTPKKATILSALSDVLVKQGRSAEALIYTRVLAEAFPGFEVAQEKYRNAVALFESSQLEEAQKELASLLEDYPNFENAAVLLAVIQFQQGAFAEAAEQLNETVDPELVHPEITRITALSNLRSNRPQKAMDMLDAFPGTQRDARLLTIYGTSALSLEQYQKGENALKRAIELEPGLTPAYLALAAHYNRQAPPQHAASLRLLREAYQRKPDDQDLARSLVSQLVITGKTKEAEQLVQRQLSESKNDMKALALAAAFFSSQKRYDEAERYFKAILKQEPDNYPAALQLGVTYALDGKPFRESLNALQNAARIAPQRIKAYEHMLRLVRSEAQFGEVTKAFAVLEKETQTRTPSAVLAAYHSARGEFDKASGLLAALDEKNTDPALLERVRYAFNVSKARRAFAAEDYAAAKESIFAGLRSRPQSAELLGMLAEIEINAGNYPEAEKIASQVASFDVATANRLQGQAMEARGELAAAVKKYLEAWQKRPDERTATKIYAMLETADPKKAQQFLQNWAGANPGSLTALSLQARRELVAGNFRAAIPMMEKIRERSPGNVTNLNNLAWAYQQTGNRQAAAVAKRAYELAPDTAAVADTYGWILYQQGQRAEAIKILERAASLDSENQEIADHLAKARAGA